MFLKRHSMRRVVGSACVALGILTAVGLLVANRIGVAAEAKDRGYIRGIETNAELDEALEDLGVKALTFVLRCPPGHKAIISFVVTDSTGKTIKDSSHQTVGFYYADKPTEWRFRLSKVDPRAIIQGYSGKIRWRLSYRAKERGSSGRVDFWDQDWFHMKGAAGSGGSTGIGKIDPAGPGEEYEIWENEIRRLRDEEDPEDRDATLLYRYRLLVKFAKAGPDDANSITTYPIDHKIE